MPPAVFPAPIQGKLAVLQQYAKLGRNDDLLSRELLYGLACTRMMEQHDEGAGTRATLWGQLELVGTLGLACRLHQKQKST